MRNIFLFISLLVISCNQKINIENLDKSAWVADTNGCKGTRIGMRSVIAGNLEIIKGLNQIEVTELLGKPDKNELYKRSQKFFIYYISPAPDCGSVNNEKYQETYLSIRFNAMGLAKEVMIYDK